MYRLKRNGTVIYTSSPKPFFLEGGQGRRYTFFDAGVGRQDGRFWNLPGRYRYELFVDGEPLTSGDFHVQ